MTSITYRAGEIPAMYPAISRGRQMSRYFLLKVGAGVAFAKWSDQFNPEKARTEIASRKNLQTFSLDQVYDHEGRTGTKDGFRAVSSALLENGMLSLPSRLVKRELWTGSPTPFESEGILIQGEDRELVRPDPVFYAATSDFTVSGERLNRPHRTLRSGNFTICSATRERGTWPGP